MSSGEGDGASIVADGDGTLTFALSLGRLMFRSAAISSKRGFTIKKNAPARMPPPRSRNIRTPAMIHGIFDFFCAAAGGNGAEGATAAVGGAGTTTSAVVCFGCSTTGGGGGGGGGGVGGVTGGRDISEVLGPVGPVLRGSATVAG